MLSAQVESLESRRLFSALNSVHARSLGITYDTSDPEETYIEASVQLTWTRADTSPIDGYHIFRSDDGKHFEQIGEVKNGAYTDTFLDTGSRYYYKVRPFTVSSGDRATLGTASVITELSQPYLTVSNPDDGVLSVSAYDLSTTPTEFKFEWRPADDPSAKVKTKIVQATLDGDGRRDFADSPGLDLQGLDPHRIYELRAYAMNSLTTSDPTTQHELPLSSPNNVDTEPLMDGTVCVTWDTSSTHTTGYRIEWARDYVDSDGNGAGSVIVGKNARSAIISDLKDGVDYAVHVVPLAGAARGEPSDQVDAARVTVLDRFFNQFGFNFDYPSPVKTGIEKGSVDIANDAAIQSGGKLIAAGESDHNFEIVRYDDTGLLDTTFGVDGKVNVDLGGDDAARAVAVFGNHILVAGTSDGRFAIVALKHDGQIDRNFGHKGKLIDDQHDASADAWNLIVDPKLGINRFYVAGVVRPLRSNGAALPAQAEIRRYVNGQLDPTWNENAAAIPRITGTNTALTMQGDGKLVLACQLGDGIAVERFNADGSVDRRFGNGGLRIVHFKRTSQSVYSLTTDASGDILLAGVSGTGAGSAFAIARLTPDGSADPKFGTDGKVYTTFGEHSAAEARDIAVLPNGQILAVGAANGNFAIAEYNTDGSLDSDFDQDGLTTTDIGTPHDIANAIALTQDGQFYLVGSASGDFAASRYYEESSAVILP